ncbi:prepilin-type N-terminal cleavage/methylation domain-containing protein [Bacillus testis]|uniref:prepilin-type N-terminal cleavage/methylation domain-containing protein n=1 Tax=Bacillus testis TaxID=1622072 RepID=UPI00067F4462|nr:prepilin-type N-terminal cleavage/methylation domain-containing protein [Bacillus testis]
MKFLLFFTNKKGFTLLEVLLAVALLGVITITVMGFFSQTFHFAKQNENRTVAVNVARSVLNYAESQDFESMNNLLSANGTIGKNGEKTIQITADNCQMLGLSGVNCQKRIDSKINDVIYIGTITIASRQPTNNRTDASLYKYLLDAKVEIKWNKQDITVKGVIKNE